GACQDGQGFSNRIVKTLACFIVGQKVSEAVCLEYTPDGPCPGRHRVPGGIVHGSAAAFPALDHPPEFCGDAFLVLRQEFKLRIADLSEAVLDISLGSQVNGQGPIKEIRAEHSIVRRNGHYEPIFPLRRFTGTWTSKTDLSVGDETLQKTRADEATLSTGAVK